MCSLPPKRWPPSPRLPLLGATLAAEPAHKRRYELWEVPGGLQCSIIGTCLAHQDLVRLTRRLRLAIEDGAADYEVHAYFVREASRPGEVARVLQKELDRRFEGQLRRVGRLKSDAELSVFWKEAYDNGRIAGAYWAVMTYSHVSEEFRQKAFGDVHMLSHVLGRTTHAAAVKASELESRIEELEAKLARQAERHAEAIAARDREITRLSATRMNVACYSQENARAVQSVGVTVAGRRHVARERALVSARERARHAEAAVERLEAQLRRVARTSISRRRRAQSAAADAVGACPGAEACRLDVSPRRVLYLGGRPSAIERLRAIAASVNAELLHHDGGVEQTADLIDGFVTRCDVVFCPIDCISHGACERAKALCRKYDKAFVPLRSSGASTFKRALRSVQP
ncbi:MAG: DUF2325 domain-containing protein [Hyphomicrobiaceae bacterium]|nr:DUF2325 domain-containing protein [Hyphomicrobiaceae bacterium]